MSRITDHMDRQNRVLRQRIINLNKENERQQQEWHTFLTKVRPPCGFSREEFEKLYSMMLRHDELLRELMNIEYRKYGMADMSPKSEYYKLAQSWLEIIEFVDMEDE